MLMLTTSFGFCPKDSKTAINTKEYKIINFFIVEFICLTCATDGGESVGNSMLEASMLYANRMAVAVIM